MAKMVGRLERDPCLLTGWITSALAKVLPSTAITVDMLFSAADRFVMYRKPLAYQTFVPGTSNYDAWPLLLKAASGATAVAPELAQRPPEPAWSKVYSTALAAGDANSDLTASVNSAVSYVTSYISADSDRNETRLGLSSAGAANASAANVRFDEGALTGNTIWVCRWPLEERPAFRPAVQALLDPEGVAIFDDIGDARGCVPRRQH